jgi:PAS domain S-box-containing protein
VSDGIEAITGYPPSALIRNRVVSYGQLIHPDDRDRIYAEVQAALQKEGAYQLDYRIDDIQGRQRVFWEQAIAVPIVGSDEVALEGYIADVTERYDVDAALLATTSALRGRVKALKCLFAVVSGTDTHRRRRGGSALRSGSDTQGPRDGVGGERRGGQGDHRAGRNVLPRSL